MVLGMIVVGIAGVYVMILVNEGTTEFDGDILCEKLHPEFFLTSEEQCWNDWTEYESESKKQEKSASSNVKCSPNAFGDIRCLP